ncbi:MAG: protoporphyrinogen oxidase, partial [Polyangiaceae bacterium]
LGREVAEKLVGPLLGGIFAGDADAISVRAAFPQLVAAEKKYGSLLIALQKQKRTSKSPSMFASLRGGMGNLIEALVSDLEKRADVTLKIGAAVRKVSRLAENSARFAIELSSGAVLEADVVVVATPVNAAASVLRGIDESAASAVDSLMGTVSSATAVFAFDRSAVNHRLDASGFIVPRTEGDELLASTWISSKWEKRAPTGRVLIRGFLGGAGHEKTLDRDDAELSALALLELRKLMPISGSPLFSRVFRFDKASPQLRVGHLARARRLREKITALANVFVIGNGYDGVGMPACIKSATETANKIVQLELSRSS